MRIENDTIAFPFEAQGVAASTQPELLGEPAPAGSTWLAVALQVRGLLTDRFTELPPPQMFDLNWASNTDCGAPDPYVCSVSEPAYLEAIVDYYDPATGVGVDALAPGAVANVYIRALVPEDDFDLATARLTPSGATGESTLMGTYLHGGSDLQAIPLGELPETPVTND